MFSESSSNSTKLAPGFRFHPTDEELVSYYLKRKISGLPLRVDAIAEIDLYKKEPWELPFFSKLQSRDVEWYFFSPLDRKYSNRTRTNRATVEGYWKTTGKDRVVKHAYSNSVVGMKKTLVYHHGRAPKGKRTNWVMHEYRLECSEDDANGRNSTTLVRPQDSFVVVRIFQKNGSGPQNGAQYGAPFIPEEWEELQGNIAPKEEEENARHTVLVHQTNVQHSDKAYVEQKNPLLVDPQQNTDHLSAESKDGQSQPDDQTQIHVAGNHLAESEGQGCDSHADDFTFMLEDIFDLDKLNNVPEDMQENDSSIANNMVENSANVSDQNDWYLELNDIANADGLCTTNNVFDDTIISHFPNEGSASQELDGSEVFDNSNRTMGTEGMFEMQQSDDFLNPAVASRLGDNTVFYDAPSNDTPYTGDVYMDMNSNDQFSPYIGDFDLVDDLMAYFDASEHDLPYEVDSLGSYSSDITHPNFAAKVEGSSYPTIKQNLGDPETNIGKGASSSIFTNATNPLETTKRNSIAATDVQSNDGWNKSFKKHVADMLDSISAPPAMAEETCKGKAAQIFNGSSLIHASAGMIKIQGVSVNGIPENWTLNKNGEISFIYTYANSNDAVEKSPCFRPLTASAAFRILLRSGLYIFGIAAVLISISLKLGTGIYSN